MIKYALECDQGHRFESWFQSTHAFDVLKNAGHLACTVCGSGQVTKALMAPRVKVGKDTIAGETKGAPAKDEEAPLAALRRHVEDTSDYVGDNFTSEARAMHLGDKPERPIYGEVRLDQAKSLIEDGVPLMPLPFAPKKKLS